MRKFYFLLFTIPEDAKREISKIIGDCLSHPFCGNGPFLPPGDGKELFSCSLLLST